MFVALVGGSALIVLALVLTLSRRPLVVAGTNSVTPNTVLAATSGNSGTCQGAETIPRGTTAVRMWLAGNVMPQVSVTIRQGTRTVATGTQEGSRLRKVTTVPITRVRHALHDARLCLAIAPAVQEVDLYGGLAPHPRPGEPHHRLTVEYLRPGRRSWWSLVGLVARRIGLGRAPAGRLTALIPLTLMLLAALLVAATALRQLGREPRRSPPPIAGGQSPPRLDAPGDKRTRVLPRHAQPDSRARRAPRQIGLLWSRLGDARRRVPVTAYVCAGVAFLSAASWSILTPPFQAPDEPSHFAYAQILAETDELPPTSLSEYSPEETTVLTGLDHQTVRFNSSIGTISTAAQQRSLEHDLALPLSRVGRGAGVAAPQPPLYYALQTIPYYLGASGTLLDQLALMRLLSAVMAAFTALFVFLFLREALPARPLAWTIGGMCAALAPLLGYASGIVNPDAMLGTVGAALLYCLARGFRRGLTPGLGVALGAVTAIGFLTKLNFLGLAPGVALALALLAWRAARTSRRSAYRSLALALVIGWGPPVGYVLVNLLSGEPALGLLSAGISGTSAHHGTLPDELGYIWQFYLFPLPGMRDYFPGVLPIRQIWFDRMIGVYGWLDTYFPNWVYSYALIPAAAIAVLCGRELVGLRTTLRARTAELISYLAVGAGLLVLMGADSYVETPAYTGAYSEPRYLLPLLALFVAAIALAARGAGRRWEAAAGTLLIMLFLAGDVFSQLIVVSRFYF